MLFSSITSATGGGPGQVDYTAANAFLDAYAQQLSAGGRNVVSVDWGEWTWNAWEAGLAGYEEALRDFFRQNRARVGIEFADGQTMHAVERAAFRRGLLVLGAGDSVIRMSPPLVFRPDQAETALQVFDEAVADVVGG